MLQKKTRSSERVFFCLYARGHGQAAISNAVVPGLLRAGLPSPQTELANAVKALINGTSLQAAGR